MKTRKPIALMLALSAVACAAVADETTKQKTKNGTTVVRDKTKPVRKALEEQYAKLAEAIRNKDFEAFQALRTADFSTKDAAGRPQTAEQMAARARGLLERIQPPIETSNEIGTINVFDNETRAVATVRQKFSRMQNLGGQLRKLETEITQEETWVLTPEGWKLHYVDGERDGVTFVDGKRVDPTKPYIPSH